MHLVCHSLLFFLLIRRTSRSTLFPYTTLFRSLLDRLREVPQGAGRDREARDRRGDRRRRAAAPRDCERERDRKSTRLNSSHSQISYAVFCLKKKTTNPSGLLPSPRRNSIHLRP